MKTINQLLKKSYAIFLFLVIASIAYGQQSTITVFHLDSKGINLDPSQLGDLARIEIGKLNKFEVMDKYDVQYAIDKKKLVVNDCYGKLCLVEIGKQIGVDKILTGSVELFGETIVITLRLLDIKNNSTEKTQIKEFLNLQNDLQEMIQLTLLEMFEMPKNTLLEERLTNKYNYENSVNNPDQPNLNLSGPRMGFTVYTGETASIMESSKSKGGFDAFPAMFQFGYQFETQYLNEGSFQALFEFIPMITGLDQGYVIPSLTVMNGIRNNINGFEIAFGPTFFLAQEAQGYTVNGEWVREGDYIAAPGSNLELETRLDSRGDMKLKSGFIIAVGKTFISGKLNIPVNAYFIPSKQGFRTGISFGYNAKK